MSDETISGMESEARLAFTRLADRAAPTGGAGDEAAALWIIDGADGLHMRQQLDAVPSERDTGEAATPIPPLAGERPAGIGPAVSKPHDAGVEQWRSLVAAYFPAHEVETALRVMQCESGGRSDAYNNGNYGLMQINAVHVGRVPSRNLADLFDPETNIKVAFEVWKASQGWSPWACW